jgi:hypothetical protein
MREAKTAGAPKYKQGATGGIEASSLLDLKAAPMAGSQDECVVRDQSPRPGSTFIREFLRAPRFGDQRTMALAGSLCLVVHAVTGFTNKSLRGLVAGLGSD